MECINCLVTHFKIMTVTICRNNHTLCCLCACELYLLNNQCPYCRQPLISININHVNLSCRLCKINEPHTASIDKLCKTCIDLFEYDISLSFQLAKLVYSDAIIGKYKSLFNDYINLYSKVFNQSLCSEIHFPKLLNHLSKKESPSDIIGLTSLFINKNKIFFTSDQCNELIKIHRVASDHRWHNLLVLSCLDFYSLSVDKFKSGICYYGNMGDKVTVFYYVKYLNDRRNLF